jgi:Ni/Co efflux regulator RcnB
MLAFQEHSISEIEKHPVSRDQNPGSANVDKGFHRNSLDEIQYFMQLNGYHSYLLFFQREVIMKRFILQMSLTLALAFAGILATSQALAERPSGAGVNKAENHKQEEMGEKYKGKKSRDQGASYDRSGHGGKGGEHFSEQNQRFIHEYYAEQFREERCPPGLAKKGNGCMPPGQAKKWRKGRPLPKDVIFYDLPPSVLGQLGPAPSGHRFVRVNQDVLLITAGKGMVVDAIEDIGREFN